MQDESCPRWVVLKFGGTSVSSVEAWRTIESIVRERIREGLRPLVVCSALSGITNELERLLQESLEGRQGPILEKIRDRHTELGAALNVDAPTLLADELGDVERIALGLSLVKEVTPRAHARVLATGEILSSKLGRAFLVQSGLSVDWIDARECLISEEDRAGGQRRYLAATCSTRADRDLQARLAKITAPALITQGFIARDGRGETVLLGRGGSDTSAAYLAAKLGAARCEIWTDVPGMYSADPRQVPEARLILRLGYDEAQEIASTGAKVLHPRSIPPLKIHGIPLHIRCTPMPDVAGTVIAPDLTDRGAEVQAIASRRGITLISMETVGMWQEVGFLADAFARFKQHGVSIDMVSTSETNVTVSLDPAANVLDGATLRELLRSLGEICHAMTIGPCAAVSLVGRNIRGVLPRLGPALEAFEEQKIHLVCQAANDLNLTLVVDEDQAEKMVRRLHELLFANRLADPLLGPMWRELAGPVGSRAMEAVPHWWVGRRSELLLMAAERAPCYIYSGEAVDRAANTLLSLAAVDRVLYAIKANPHPGILERLHRKGIGFECASLGEVLHLLRLIPGIDPGRIVFTPNFAPRAEYAEAFDRGVRVTVDNLYPLREWGELFRGREIFLRIDPGEGRGHHRHVRTAGAGSKFGVTLPQAEEALVRAGEVGAKVVGLHAHTGSGIMTPENWSETAMLLASLADSFPDVRILDVGGGLGVPERPGQPGLDISTLEERLGRARSAHPRFELWLEPGRYLVAGAGVLLARVTQIKRKGDINYVGIETGMNSLIRPALYGAWHEIVNLSRLDEPATMVADIVGPICETGDVLGHARHIAPPREGDLILIATAGAYGRSMSSNYNLREPATEYVLAGQTTGVA